MPVPTSKTFEFTIFPKESEERELEWFNSLEWNKLVVYREYTEENKLHLQGQITWKRSYSAAAVKKLHNYAHWEFSKAECDANYSRKITSIKLIDEDRRKKRGERTDLEIARNIVKTTYKMRDVVEATTSCQAIRSSEIWLKYREPERRVGPIEVIWYWGESGSGKTRAVYEENEEVFRPTTYKWWEGYDGHEVVLFDEFRRDFCKFHELLALLDIYPYRVETKGGSRQMVATKIYITSCFSPENMYETREDLYQLTRRITTIKEFKKGRPEDEKTEVRKGNTSFPDYGFSTSS